MTETTTYFDSMRASVELTELDSLDIVTTGRVRVTSGHEADVICLTIPVDLGVLGGEIAVTLPRKEIADHLLGSRDAHE